MKRTVTTKIFLLTLLIAGLCVIPGCDSVRGGAQVSLEGLTVGELTMDGKPVQGLPTGSIDIILKVSANQVNIRSTVDGAVITLSPSGATIISGPDGMSITGVEPDQIEMKWRSAE